MRVMNVKFVGRIIMTVLFVFICIGVHAGDDPLKYEIEGSRSVQFMGCFLKDFPARLHAPGRNLWQEVWW